MIGDRICDALLGGSSPQKSTCEPDLTAMMIGNQLEMNRLMTALEVTRLKQNAYMEKRELQKEQVEWAKDVIKSGRGQEGDECPLLLW